ncbi:MAG: helix-turn-helix domain-containing protein [Candidatus Scatosoma sp.]
MIQFAQRVKELRTEKNMTRKALAKVMNVSERLIGYWEAGQRECDFATLAALSAFFEVSADYLLGITEY